MKKGILPKLSMGLALAGACVLSQASRVLAAGELGDTVTFMEPARALVMPFDETTNKKSFQIVTRTGGDDTGVGVIATHWSYWSKDCDHLADVFICLTRKDTVVVDPTALQSEIQSPNPPVNNKVGPIINLSGQKGMLTVTAFEADTGSSGLGCNVSAPDATVADAIARSMSSRVTRPLRPVPWMRFASIPCCRHARRTEGERRVSAPLSSKRGRDPGAVSTSTSIEGAV